MAILPAKTIDMGPMGTFRTEAMSDHGFGLSFGFGVEAWDRCSLGYTLEYSTSWKSTSHYAKIGVRF